MGPIYAVIATFIISIGFFANEAAKEIKVFTKECRDKNGYVATINNENVCIDPKGIIK